MPIGLIRPITTQKVIKTCSNKSVKQHCLCSNHLLLETSESFSTLMKSRYERIFLWRAVATVETQRSRREHFSLVLSNRSSNFHQSIVEDALIMFSVSLLQSSFLRTGRSLAHLLWFPQAQCQTH